MPVMAWKVVVAIPIFGDEPRITRMIWIN